MTRIKWVDSLPGHATYRWESWFCVQINRPKWKAMSKAMRDWYAKDLFSVTYRERGQ